MSQALATRDAEVTALANDIRGEKTLAQIQAVLPENVPVSRFVRAAVTAISENPDLVDVDRGSLFLALVKTAQDGLLPDGRESALIPFKDKKRGLIATYIPMIGGFRKIAGEHGWSIETAVVRENDTFEFERGSDPRVVHRQPKLGAERGPMVGAYAIGRHRSMPTQIVVLDAGEVEKIKKTSRALNFGPWKDWEPQMWEKTAGRKLFKQLPLGERETERIRRLLADTDLTDPAAALYGPRAEIAAAAPDGPAAPESAAGAHGVGDERPQSAGPSAQPEGPAAPGGFDWSTLSTGDTAGPPAPASADATGDDPTPAPAAPVEQLARGEAGDVLAPKELPGYGGQPICEIAGSARGRDLLLAVLVNAPIDNEFRAVVAEYARDRMPELWSSYTQQAFGGDA